MQTAVGRFVPWLILVASFVILAISFNAVPSPVIISRSFFGSPDTVGPKSLFTVFRVPMIDAICALAAVVLYRRFLIAAPDLAGFWLILLYTAACKSLLQAIEMVSSPAVANVFFYLTVACVAIGIALAFYATRKHLSGFISGLGKFTVAETLVLVILLIAYVGIAIVPLFVYP